MKKSFIFIPFLCLAACGMNPFNRTVADPLIGKALIGPQVIVLFNEDGTVSGNFRGEIIAGTYTASETEICNRYTSPANFIELGETCSVPVITGNIVVFNRRDGTQSPPYTIQG